MGLCSSDRGREARTAQHFLNLFFQPLEKEGTLGLLNKRKKRSRGTYMNPISTEVIY